MYDFYFYCGPSIHELEDCPKVSHFKYINCYIHTHAENVVKLCPQNPMHGAGLRIHVNYLIELQPNHQYFLSYVFFLLLYRKDWFIYKWNRLQQKGGPNQAETMPSQTTPPRQCFPILATHGLHHLKFWECDWDSLNQNDLQSPKCPQLKEFIDQSTFPLRAFLIRC